MNNPTLLEHNYLTTILLLNYFNNKIVEKHKKSNKTIELFKLENPAYIDIPMAMMHLAIINARKLYESNNRIGLSEADWNRLRDLRNLITHAKNIEDQKLREIAKAPEIFEILNRLNKYLYEKYDLNDNLFWLTHIKNYYRDLENY